MDKVSDFFKELKERLSSPLFFSFVISWCIINWKILTGLCLYTIPELKMDGYNSYIDLISKNSDVNNVLWKPTLAAFGYTFIFPFFRNCIYAFNSWIKAWGNNWNLKLSKSSKISISKYIGLREVYEARTNLLEDVLEKESNFIKENEELRNSNLALINEKNKFYQELQEWKNLNNVGIINGTWEYSYTADLTKEKRVTKVYIKSGLIEHVNDGSSMVQRNKDEILNFYYNPSSKQMSFLVATPTNDVNGIRKFNYHHYSLEALDEMKILRGFEDQQYTIQYKKLN